MASNTMHFLLIALLATTSVCAGRNIPADQTMPFEYHKGPLLTGKVSVNLIWYGKFTPSQRAIVSDFITSLSSSPRPQPEPSVATWVGSVEKYYKLIKMNQMVQFTLGKQTLNAGNSLGKPLTMAQIQQLAAEQITAPSTAVINVVLTASDVAVEGFCSSKCGTHGSFPVAGKGKRAAYIWVGNSETQCPGQCAWPFHQPIYGPQGPPLVAPNGDVGVDGMVINLATLLAGTATNPFGNGYYQGPAAAPLEAATACTGIFGKGAYPGYAGNLLVDPSTGGSYNANGANKRKFLLPALFDPASSSCSTLV